MNATKKIRRLALVTIVLSATGCQSTTGLSTSNFNPFNRTASAEKEGKIAVVEVPNSKPGSGSSQEEGFTTKLASAGTSARNMVTGLFGFGKTATTIADPSQPTDALSLANTPTKLGPEVYVANGQLWESSGSFDRAMENYSKALQTDPKNAPALGAIARLNDRQNNLPESVTYFERAIAVEPSEPTLYNDLGLVLARQEKYDAAVEQIQKAIAIAPGNKRFANNLATVHMDAGNADKAMAALTTAHDPAVAHYNMAYLNFKREQVGEARNQLETALKIDPNLEPARNLLDKLGGTQVAQLAKDTMNAASAVAQNAQSVSDNVQQTYQAVTQSNVPITETITSGLTDVTAPYGTPTDYKPTATSVPSIGATTPAAPTTVVAPPAEASSEASSANGTDATAPSTPPPAATASPSDSDGGFSMPPTIAD